MRTVQVAQRRAPYLELLCLGAALGAILLLYRGAFGGFFVQDDYGWLESSRFQSAGEYLKCFFRFNPALTYRPVSQEGFFWMGQKLFGMNPTGFHTVAILVHLAGCGVLYLLARQFFAPAPSIAATLFYGLHGAHLRSVYWISAFPEPLALFFYVSAIMFFVRFDRLGSRAAYALSFLAMILGMMSKESILTVPLVAAAYCILFSRRTLPWTLPFFALSGIYGVLRLTSSAVRAAPYPLTFGREAWNNLLAYFSWSGGLSETLLKIRLRWVVESSYGPVALGFVIVVTVLLLLARDRRIALFGLLWFLLALQPVLYFWQHIDAYYLAPSLAGLAILVGASFPASFSRRNAARWILPSAVVLFTAWAAHASVRFEGRWWNQRSLVGRDIIARLPAVDRQFPPGKVAYVFGFTGPEFGIMQNDAAFKAYGYLPSRFILMGLDPDTPRQIAHLKRNEGLGDYYCFVYRAGEFLDMTAEFRRRPAHFLFPVRLEAARTEVRAGQDKLTLRVINLEVHAIDVQYRLNGATMPPIYSWPVNADGSITLFVDAGTARGLYEFTALRDSEEHATWYPIDLRVNVR